MKKSYGKMRKIRENRRKALVRKIGKIIVGLRAAQDNGNLCYWIHQQTEAIHMYDPVYQVIKANAIQPWNKGE